jgi:hypothetical protein
MSHIPTSRPIRPDAPATGQEAVETIVDPPPAAHAVPARPAPPRFAPKPGVRVEVRPWAAGAGQNVAVELLDLSEVGVRVRLRLAVRVSGRFEVTVRDAEGRRWLRGLATIAGSAPVEDGTVAVLLTFGQPLLSHVIRALGGDPVPAPAGG